MNPEPAAVVSDEALALQLQQGNDDALAPLMERYEERLMRYGNRFLAGQRHDVLRQAVQDIFISVYQNIASYDATQRFSPWIYRIAHNMYVDILRQNSRQLFGIDFDTLISHPVQEDTFAKEKENEELRVLLEKGLSVLSPALREVIVLYYFEDLDYREISDVLHIPVSTVGVRLARARERLKKELPDASNFDL